MYSYIALELWQEYGEGENGWGRGERGGGAHKLVLLAPRRAGAAISTEVV